MARLIINTFPIGRFRLELEFRELDVDRGLAIHVFGPVSETEEEILRFDCFENEPHYHLAWSYKKDPFIPISDGDPFRYSLELLRSRVNELLKESEAELMSDGELTELSRLIPTIQSADKNFAVRLLVIRPSAPEGFELDEPADAVYGDADSWYRLVGPLFHSKNNTPGCVELCFYSERRYISSMNRVHGGMMSSFMDYVLFGAAASSWGGIKLATVSLNLNFVSACPPDVWVTGRGEVIRTGKSMAFVTGQASAEGRVIVHATGTFRGS